MDTHSLEHSEYSCLSEVLTVLVTAHHERSEQFLARVFQGVRRGIRRRSCFHKGKVLITNSKLWVNLCTYCYFKGFEQQWIEMTWTRAIVAAVHRHSPPAWNPSISEREDDIMPRVKLWTCLIFGARNTQREDAFIFEAGNTVGLLLGFRKLWYCSTRRAKVAEITVIDRKILVMKPTRTKQHILYIALQNKVVSASMIISIRWSQGISIASLFTTMHVRP